MAAVLCLQAAGAFKITSSASPLSDLPKLGNKLLTTDLIKGYTEMILRENSKISPNEDKGSADC